MSLRNLRSSKLKGNSRTSDTTTTTTPTTTVATTSTQIAIPTLSTNAVTPLMSIRFPQGFGQQSSSSPSNQSTITTPTYSSLTAREISGQGSDTVQRNTGTMSQDNQNLPPTEEISNEDARALRQYVSASVEAAQVSIMREVQNMQLMLPQLIRESLRSERATSFDHQNNQEHRSFQTNHTYQPHTQPNAQRPQHHYFQSNMPQQQRPYPPIPQPLFGNTSQNFSQPYPDFTTHHVNQSYSHITPNQLEKWGLKFDGTNKSFTVEDFVFRVEVLKNDYNCPWDVVMKGFHHLVTGAASTWFWSYRMKYPVSDWNNFKYEIIRKFRNFESDFEIQRKIMERRQQHNESADTYITEIIKLKNQMRIHVLESELVKIVKDNLKDGLAQLIFPIKIDNLDQLLEECKRAERNIAKRTTNRMPMLNNRKIYEVDIHSCSEEDEQALQVEAIQQEKLSSKPLKCWNCKAPGHSFIECTVAQRSVFCYRCGFEDVTSPSCPRCAGNYKLNTRKTGPACSNPNANQ